MTESAHQRAIFKWGQQPHIRNKFPELKFLFHVKNETTEGASRVKSDGYMGVRKGVPDLCLPVPKRGYHGLWIELKNETGRASKEQKWWLEELGKLGHKAVLCRGWQEAIRTLEWYLNDGEV